MSVTRVDEHACVRSATGAQCGISRPSVLHVVTPSWAVPFLRGQLHYLTHRGFDVLVSSAPGHELQAVTHEEGIRAIPIPIAREISPWKDLIAFVHLFILVRRVRPTITNVSTPKAGLLGGLAAWLNGVPCRVYTLRGLRCETARGVKLRILWVSERITCWCAHRVICVSESLREAAIKAGVVNRERTTVIGSGSSNGVEESRFMPTKERQRKAVQIRREFNIPADAPVVGFAGRLTRDKGISELYEAHRLLRNEFPALRLMLVGDYEEGDKLPLATRQSIEDDPSVIRTGVVSNSSDFYHVFNVVAFPSHREGFPNTILEAHASGKPVVATRATGTVDAIVDGVSGFLVPVGNAKALAEKLAKLLGNPTLAEEMGTAGRARVVREYQPESIWKALTEEYVELLRVNALPLPISEIPPWELAPFERDAASS